MSLTIWKWPVASWSQPQPFCDASSSPARESQAEQKKIKIAWDGRDRASVRSYDHFLRLRATAHAKMACSAAIAAIRVAVQDRDYFDAWLLRRSNPPGTGGSGTGWGTGSTWGAGAGWGVSPPDPTWDGVTRVPKTPQKAKRRRLRKRLLREHSARVTAHFKILQARYESEQRERNAGWIMECH
ncbi:hypothetical protein B0H11DRAFT_2240368 [Mycena galericulata]|nr:hypothetical protein B0H11DRAFT_2240368 [Mycena galericulata]